MKAIVSIIMGSTSDLPVMEKACKFLDDMQVPFEVNALSAHRTPDAVEEFARNAKGRGIRVIIAGLDMDFRGVPFGPMPALCAIADDVTKVHAICVKCGSLAYVSHRTVENDKRVLLGETQEYEPLCRECYQKAMAEEAEKAKNKKTSE